MKVFTAIGSRVRAIGIALIHGMSDNREPWEESVLRNARNISRLIDEVGLERMGFAESGFERGVNDVDRVLAHLQHKVTQQVREILEDRENPYFNEALALVLDTGQLMAEIQGLDNFPTEARSEMSLVQWLSVRASVYTELTGNMKYDAMCHLPGVDITRPAAPGA